MPKKAAVLRDASKKPLWAVSIATTREAEEAVVELCETTLGEAAVSYTDVDTNEVIVTAYLPEWSYWRERRVALQAGLAAIKSAGLNSGAGSVSFRRIRRQDWAESWKRHFRPIQIGRMLLVKPGWSKRRGRKGQAVVVLDPGLSFGTGQHPTTEFCLRQLAKHRKPAKRQSFLDVGTGSGILAIAAAKLGYAPIEAFDCDAISIRVARTNARRNQVERKLNLRQADLAQLPLRSTHRHHLVCANLTSDLLISECRRIAAQPKPGGILVLAGILEAEFQKVRRVYEQAGLKLLTSASQKGWRSAAFVSKPPPR